MSSQLAVVMTTPDDELKTEFKYGSHRCDRPFNVNADYGESGTRNYVYLGQGITIRDLSDALVRALAASQTNISKDCPKEYDDVRERLRNEAELGEDAVIPRRELMYIKTEDLCLTAVINRFECEIEKLLGIYPNIPFN
jgi:hypothetical protein